MGLDRTQTSTIMAWPFSKLLRLTIRWGYYWLWVRPHIPMDPLSIDPKCLPIQTLKPTIFCRDSESPLLFLSRTHISYQPNHWGPFLPVQWPKYGESSSCMQLPHLKNGERGPMKGSHSNPPPIQSTIICCADRNSSFASKESPPTHPPTWVSPKIV